jgi:lipooligosaccharide transport system permease protein
VGVAIGDFSPIGALLLLPACFLFGLIFSALGLLVAAKSNTIEAISYPQYLFVFPMFLFCGVFFPLSNLPSVVQLVVGWLPLSAVLAVIRSLTLGVAFEPVQLLILGAWTLVLVPWARRAMIQRLVA